MKQNLLKEIVDKLKVKVDFINIENPVALNRLNYRISEPYMPLT